ncbi:Nucleolar protein fibrillarin NOP77 (RRM superfamily) [Phaffia rhodozyma]|uniref:Nucleolar protein fibrillarin NOP77 (RRM superfamily) n=1 Tax=Phaffia rhodozyma TaxID=264483 RepID=A0A0F7SQP4_PHARH|nr:Nucleolar protein fibrillarin NOP77 (RRM superfamily) [Phaffia rhodozyma]
MDQTQIAKAVIEDDSSAPVGSTLFVSNLPYSATTTDLTTHFSDIGPVRSAFVVLDKTTKKSKGVGYVMYAMKEDAERAVKELHGGSFGDGKDRRLGVVLAEKKPLQADPSSTEPAPPVERITKRRPAFPTTPFQPTSANSVPTNSAPSGSRGGYDSDAIRTVVISNIPEGLTKAKLWKKIRKVAGSELGNLVFPVDNDETVAHLLLPSPAAALDATIRLHAHDYLGNILSCVIKKRTDKIQAATGKDGGVHKNSRMIVRNLPWDTTLKTLQRLFLPHGPIHSITLPPSLPGKPTEANPNPKPRARGFAFVWMLSRKDAEKAMESVNGTKVIGEDGKEEASREVAVDWALSKDQYEKEKEEEPVEEETEEAEAEVEKTEEGVMEVDEEEDEEKEKDEEPVRPALPQVQDQTTLFVRNLSFEVTEDELRNLFRTFGNLRYARITMDRATGRSRGTGFVCFWRKEDAEKAVEQARLMASEMGGSGANSVPVKDRTAAASNPFTLSSVLTADPSSSLASNMVLNGRVLDVDWAVTREEAGKMKEENERRKEKVDKKNTYLMREGVIFANSPAAASLSEIELEKRQKSFNDRKTLLSSNPSLYISKTRLSIRQLPTFCTDRTLKRLAIHACREFDAEVGRGEREDLDEDEKRDGTLSAAVLKSMEDPKKKKKAGRAERQTVVVQAKIVRATDRVDSLIGEGKSKGYGFLEMRSHQDALKALRWANNNPTVENLMREWWAVEVGDLIERTKKLVDEARLAELTAVAAPEPIRSHGPKKKGKGRADAEASDIDEEDMILEETSAKAVAGKKGGKDGKQAGGPVDLGELELRLMKLREKESELKEQIASGRSVVMKKTLIIEFSIENIQVVQRRTNRMSGPREPRGDRDPSKRKFNDEPSEGTDDRSKRRRPGQNREREGGPAGGDTNAPAEDPSVEKEKRERKELGLLIGKKRRERKEKRSK